MNKFKESVSVLNSNREKIGIVDREEGINKNLLLEAVQIWVINPDTNQVLMQRRSYDKENDPGMIDVSASGHVKNNEVPIQAIIRETKEEIGLNLENSLQNVKKLYDLNMDLSKEGRKGVYITHEYLTYSKLRLEEYIKQDEEVEELFFMDYEEVKRLIRNKDKEMRIPYNEDTEKLFNILDREIYNKENEPNVKEVEK